MGFQFLSQEQKDNTAYKVDEQVVRFLEKLSSVLFEMTCDLLWIDNEDCLAL